MNRRFSLGMLFVALLVAIATPLSTAPKAEAQGAVTLKIATLYPANSSLMRTLQAWGQSVREHTGGQVVLEFVSRGRTANEREFVTGMGSGTYDGAVLSASGLNAAAPGALVLAAPGVVTDYARLDRARSAMASELNQVFASAPNGGYRLVGWADYGRARLFTKTPFARPSDLNGRKLWVSPDDAVGAAIAQATGAQRVNVPMSRVAAELDAGNIDAVYASPVAVVSMNWHSDTRLRYVTQESFGIVVGATVLKTASYNRIPAQHRAAFDQDAARAHQALNRTIRRDDDRNYTTAIQRGVTAVNTAPAASDWNAAFQRARQSMTGSTFPANLLTRLSSVR